MTDFETLQKKISEKKCRVCVVGMGYIGLPTALHYAKNEIEVVGLDINEELVAELGEGRIRMEEEGLDELAEKYLSSVRLETDYRCTGDCEIAVLCLPSPIDQGHRPVLRYLEGAIEELAEDRRDSMLILVESTVPVGTTRHLAQKFAEVSGLEHDKEFWFAHCPERVLPGQVVKELESNHRLAGGLSSLSTQLAVAFLETVFDPQLVHPTTAEVSEAAKLAENAYRDVNIAYVNELAKICKHFAIDVTEVIKFANLHPRVSMLNPGLGVGGYCIPKDGWILLQGLHYNEVEADLIPSARRVNDSMPSFVFSEIQRVAMESPLTKQHVGVLGLSFKPNVSDTRNSPSVELLRMLSSSGFKTAVYDPLVDYDFGSKKVSDMKSLLDICEIIVIGVGHDVILDELEKHSLGEKILVDPWNLVPHLKSTTKRYIGLTTSN